MSLGFIAYFVFMNIANLVKDELTGLTEIHQHNAQNKHAVCDLKHMGMNAMIHFGEKHSQLR